MAEYFRRVLLSLDTDGIFYWLFLGHQWWSVQAQLLYSTDASALFLSLVIFDFFLFFKTNSMVKWTSDIYYCAAPFLLVIIIIWQNKRLDAQSKN